MWQAVLMTVLTIAFWGTSIWLFVHRKRPDQISMILPLTRRQRQSRLHPLFAETRDVLALSGLFFLIGLLTMLVLAAL